jgi:hypothetical protein
MDPHILLADCRRPLPRRKSSCGQKTELLSRCHDQPWKCFASIAKFTQRRGNSSTPLDLQSFLYTLGSARSDSLRSVTLFHIDQRHDRKIDKSLELRLKDAILTMRLLPGLRKFHLLIELGSREHDEEYQDNPAELRPRTYPSQLPCAEGLFKLRNLTDIACSHLPAEDWKNNPRSLTEPGKDMSGPYKHFSHGLQLAQKGSVNSKLYTNPKWYRDELWPVLNGSDCGVRKGCTYGQKEHGPEGEDLN